MPRDPEFPGEKVWKKKKKKKKKKKRERERETGKNTFWSIFREFPAWPGDPEFL